MAKDKGKKEMKSQMNLFENGKTFHRSQLSTTILYKPIGIFKKICYLEHINYHIVSDSVAYIHLCIHTHKPIPYSNCFRAEVLQEFRRNLDKNGEGVVDVNIKARLIFVESNQAQKDKSEEGE